MPEYGFSKARLPKARAYPLKRSALDRLLDEAGITSVHGVYFGLGTTESPVLAGHFCGDDRKGFAARGKCSVSITAVPSDKRAAIETTLLREALPPLIAWLKALESADGKSTLRAVDRTFAAYWECGAIRIETA